METKAGHSSSGDWAVWYEDYQLILDSSCLHSKDCTITNSITQNPEITVRQMKEVYSHPNEIGLWFIPIHIQTSYVYTKPKMILFGCVEWDHWSWLSLPLDLITFMDSRENSFLLSISYFYFFFFNCVLTWRKRGRGKEHINPVWFQDEKKYCEIKQM